MRLSTIAGLALALLLALLSLPRALAYTGGPVAKGGSVEGVVRFLGKAPALQPLVITKDPAHCGKQPIFEESLQVSKAKGLANVIVFFKKIERGKKTAPGEATLTNVGCRYEPHVQAFVVGTTLFVKNSDSILHNTHIVLSRATIFNYALPRKGQIIHRKIKRKGLMKVGCDAGHDWMKGYIAAFEHPYFAVTDKDGRFALSDVPPGTYKLMFWHEKLGQKSQLVTVNELRKTDITFSFKK